MPESADNFHETWCAYYVTVSPHLYTPFLPTIYKRNMAAYANLWGETTTKQELWKFWAIAEV